MIGYYYTSALEPRLQGLFSRFRDAVVAKNNSCIFNNCTHEEAKMVISAFCYDNPDSYKIAPCFCMLGSRGRDTVIVINYSDNDESLFNSKLDEILTRLQEKMTPGMDTYQKVKVIYDYLAMNCKYDYDCYDEYLEIDRTDTASVVDFVEKYNDRFTAYGPIVEGIGVCSGLSLALKLLLRYFNIESIAFETKLVDNAGGDIAHMCNLVELPEGNSYIDMAGGVIEDVLEMVRYDYFLVSHDIMIQHIEIPFELEDNYSCSYFTREKLEFRNTESLRKFLGSVGFERIKGEIRFRYTGKCKQSYIEKILKCELEHRLGANYELFNYSFDKGICNCKIKRRER